MPVNPLPIPREPPPEYEASLDEPRFDPARHLALEAPARTWRLEDLGYTDAQIRNCASPVAVAGPFRLLSAEGAAAARAVALALRDRRQAGDRTANGASDRVALDARVR